MILVTGAGGFLGGHLVRRLLDEGYAVRAVDLKPAKQWYQIFDDCDEIMTKVDLQDRAACDRVCEGIEEVYGLACDMGGIGYIEGYRLRCQLSVLMSTNMLLAAADAGVGRYFYASSACVYPEYRQTATAVRALGEDDAYPAMPEDGYGWEKLYTERTAQLLWQDRGFETRIARYHNIFGPDGTWDGGREKAPAAICRKVAQAVLSGRHEIEIWGDGEQTRSFCYVDDCVEGTRRMMESGYRDPLNIGSDRLISINDLVTMVEGIAGVTLQRTHNLDAPQGVRGRNSDNSRIRAELGWAPCVPLEDGMAHTYGWVYDQVKART